MRRFEMVEKGEGEQLVVIEGVQWSNGNVSYQTAAGHFGEALSIESLRRYRPQYELRWLDDEPT